MAKKLNRRQKRFFKDDFVNSTYRGRWSGIILKITERSEYEDLAMVLLLKDRNGNTPRKRVIKTLSVGWLTKIKPFDITNINPDWYKGLGNFLKIN